MLEITFVRWQLESTINFALESKKQREKFYREMEIAERSLSKVIRVDDKNHIDEELASDFFFLNWEEESIFHTSYRSSYNLALYGHRFGPTFPIAFVTLTYIDPRHYPIPKLMKRLTEKRS